MKKVIVLFSVYDDKSGSAPIRVYNENSREFAEKDKEMLEDQNTSKNFYLSTCDFIE